MFSSRTEGIRAQVKPGSLTIVEHFLKGEEGMTTIRKHLAGILFILSSSSLVLAQTPSVDRINVPLSDPGRPVTLRVGLISGSITVKGSSTKEVVVEARTRFEEYEREERSEAPPGLRRIPNTSTGLSVEEDDNVVRVSTGSRGGSRTIDLTIEVPTACSMKLSTINDGDIKVQNVTGDLEINNTNGHVTLTGISGSAVAHALNGDLVVTFVKVNPQRAMSFSSLNGKIDVTLPADTKASLYLKDEMGEIYSDFDMKVEPATTKVEEGGKGKVGRYHVKVEKAMRGVINGGGVEMQFSNFNGDIYIRKGK
jgi:hypothetical protein